MNTILQTVAGNPENQDRSLVLHDGSRIVLCIANGVWLVNHVPPQFIDFPAVNEL
jgi:RNA:NAD 2'-phosphotransferase (TPT1/KptA family)